MTESNHPSSEPDPIRPLATSGRRALAGAMVATAAADIGLLSAVIAVDVLDAMSWAVLGTTGCTAAEARAVLAALWTTDPAGEQP